MTRRSRTTGAVGITVPIFIFLVAIDASIAELEDIYVSFGVDGAREKARKSPGLGHGDGTNS
jgi:hypothetical protein